MPLNPDGTLRAFTADEVALFQLGTRGVRDGTHPEETYGPDGAGCTRKWLCAWAQRFNVIEHLVGAAVWYESAGTPFISRLMPQSHPTFANWICTKATVTGHKFLSDDDPGTGNPLPRYDMAEVTAQYEMVPFKLAADADVLYEIDRYVTEPGYPECEGEGFSEYLNMPGGIMEYRSGGAAGRKIPYNIGFTQGGEKISCIWRRVPKLAFGSGTNLFNRVYGDPLNGVLPWIGTVNETALFGRKPLTCLLESVQAKLRPDPLGRDYAWDIKYTWIFKPQTHLRLYFFETAAPPVIANGWYTAGKPGAPADPTAFSDGDGLFPIRDHATGLFSLEA